MVKVDKESDKYYVWDRADTFRVHDDLLAPGAVAKTIEFGFSKDNYYAEEYGLRTRILWRDMNNADSVLRLEMNKSRKLVDSLMLGREKRVAAKTTALASFASGLSVTKSGTAQWDNAGYTGDPIQEIDAMKEAVRKASGMTPNTIVIGSDVVLSLVNNAKYKEHYKYTADDLAGNGLPPVLRGLRVVVPGSVSTTSGEGASSVALGDIWGKIVLVAYVNPDKEPTADSFSFAYTFRAKQFETRKYAVEEQRANYIETNYLEDVKVVSNVGGYIAKNVVA